MIQVTWFPLAGGTELWVPGFSSGDAEDERVFGGALRGSSHLSGDWRVRMRGGEGRLGQVTPPVWSSTRSR